MWIQKKRIAVLLMAVVMLLFNLSIHALAMENPNIGGASNHPEHIAECGYNEGAEGTLCDHEHTENCHTLLTECVHKHGPECYLQEGVSDNTATLSDAGHGESTECTHECSVESGCITKGLNCLHEHHERCGYIPATEGAPSTFVYEECNSLGIDDAKSSNIDDVTLKLDHSVYTGEKLYQGYNEQITLSNGEIRTGIRIKDGIDEIAYCYDLDSGFPSGENSESITLYSKIENYLASHDPFVEKYGADKKTKVAIALYAGYPNDAYGIREEYNITDDEARYMTQNLIWDITTGHVGPYEEDLSLGISQSMANYYNRICKYIENLPYGAEFERATLKLTGDFEFRKNETYWMTDVVSFEGNKGTIRFQNLPEHFEIRAKDGSKITSDIAVGQEFYLCFNGVEKPELKEYFIVEHSYKEVEFYFYTYKTGGFAHNKSIQNVIRLQSTDNVNKAFFKVTFAGEVNKTPDTPDTPDPTPKTGSLTVSKVVAGNAGDKQKDFHFTVTLSGDETVSGTFDDLTFTDSVATFTLKHGESKKATALPAGISYTVAEAEDGQDGYTTTKTGNTGTIEADKTATAVFTNTKNSTPPDPDPKTGKLTVSKVVAGNAGDKQKDFHFTVTLSNKTISGTFGDMTFTNGTAAFTLKHGESKTVENLPVGISYEVTETEADQNGYVTTKIGDSGTIKADMTATAAFTNKKTSGGGGDSSYTRLTVKKVWVLDDGGKAATSVNVTLLRNGKRYDEVTLNADNGWEHTWTRLNDRYNWSVAEVDVPDGFISEVSQRGTTWTITNNDIPTDPVDPVDPLNPVKLIDPVKPTDPTNPAVPAAHDSETPTNPAVPAAHDSETPTNPAVPAAHDSETPTNPAPRTGDETNLILWLILLSISTVGIITTLTAAKPAYKGKHCKR